MDAQTLHDTLTGIAVQAVPTETNLWPAIQRRLAGRPAPAPASRRPRLRLAVGIPMAAATLAVVALVVGQILVPGRMSTAEAAALVRSDPAVAALLRGEIVNVEVTEVVGNTATVVVQGSQGEQVSVNVDLLSRVATVTYHGPQLSPGLTATALDVIRADPRASDLLARGATLGRIMPIAVSMEGVDPVTGQPTSASETWAQVPLELDGQEWTAYVDLPAKRISQLVDPHGNLVPLP